MHGEAQSYHHELIGKDASHQCPIIPPQDSEKDCDNERNEFRRHIVVKKTAELKIAPEVYDTNILKSAYGSA